MGAGATLTLTVTTKKEEEEEEEGTLCQASPLSLLPTVPMTLTAMKGGHIQLSQPEEPRMWGCGT